MIQRVRLKHVNPVRGKDGKTRYYHRKTRERLPDGEAARAARVLAINAALEAEDEILPGTLADLIRHYKTGQRYKRLAPATKASYDRHFDRILTAGGMRVAEIDVPWLYRAQDTVADTPRMADQLLEVLSVLLNFAVKRGWRTDNPARHVERLGGGKSYEPWPDVAIGRFRTDANPRMVWAMEIALYTGQRRADVLEMQWRHIADGLIAVAQQKTGQRLHIPIHAGLAAVLADIPRVGTNIVHREDGRAYTGGGFSAIFRRELKRLGLAGLQFHGLRHTAAARLAEAECTDREIMAILGHRTATMVSRYTRQADQKRLATAAITKLETQNFARAHGRSAKVPAKDRADDR